MIDPDTPQEFMTRTGFDGNSDWELVFSDEFNEDGRTFYEGDDPFWQGESEFAKRMSRASTSESRVVVLVLVTIPLGLGAIAIQPR
jgi:beta-glucanase (GH16 family)